MLLFCNKFYMFCTPIHVFKIAGSIFAAILNVRRVTKAHRSQSVSLPLIRTTRYFPLCSIQPSVAKRNCPYPPSYGFRLSPGSTRNRTRGKHAHIALIKSRRNNEGRSPPLLNASALLCDDGWVGPHSLCVVHLAWETGLHICIYIGRMLLWCAVIHICR